jgi:hypothetical protein
MNNLNETIQRVLRCAEVMATHVEGGRIFDVDVLPHPEVSGAFRAVSKYTQGHESTHYFQDDQEDTRERRMQLEFMLFGAASAAFEIVNRKQGAAQ